MHVGYKKCTAPMQVQHTVSALDIMGCVPFRTKLRMCFEIPMIFKTLNADSNRSHEKMWQF